MAVDHPVASAQRLLVAEAIATWARSRGFTTTELGGLTAYGRAACARLARAAHPSLTDKPGYVPSTETWQLAERLLTIAEVEPDGDDPFAGFPQ